MKKDNYILSLILIFIAICSLSMTAQVESFTPQVFQSIHNDTSPPLSEMQEAPLSATPWKNGIIRHMSKDHKYEDNYQMDESLQDIMGSGEDGFILQNWDGIAASGYAPPDASGDVGPSHYMEMVNVRFQIWNKTGTSLLGPSNLGTIWSGFPGPWASSLNDGDPVVLYDEVAGRWFAAQFSLPNYPSGPFYILIAVSQTGNPTGSWHRYGFSFTHMPDYPKFGIWPDGYYMSANSFSSGSLIPNGTYAAAFDRSQMLNGNAATMVSFLNSSATTWSLLPADWNGTVTPPSGAPNYFGQIHDNAEYGGNDGFDIYQFHVDWVTPANSTFTGPTFLATNAFSTVNGIPQSGTSQLLDNLSVMTMNRLDYRNFGTHQSMVVCHTIDAGSSRAGVRWYEFRKTSGNWSIYQQGTYAPADGLERWMGSIALNSSGDIALGYSVSSSTMFPAIRYTGRMAGDTPGVMTLPEETIQAGLGSQTGLSRWGDYTQMVVDPDGKTFWYVNQYQPSTGSFNWKTRIASMKFGISDPTNVTATPVSYSQINIGFTPNSTNNNVIVVWNLTGTFTTPSGTPPAAGQPFAGGTLLYNGIVSPVSHTGLNTQTTYYYKLFSYDGSSYSTGIGANATTLNISNPTNVTAAPINSTQINVGFIPNSNNNNVIVVWNLTGTFTTPVGTPPSVGQSFVGGTLLYNGIVSPVQHIGLTAQTTYYYKLFSYNGSVYSTGVATNATTLNIADPTNVTATPISESQIDLSFTPNASNNNAVLVWNLSGTFTTPSGTPPSVGQPFAGGTLLYNGTVSPVNHTGLNPLTTYYYKAFSYDGANYSSGVTVNATTLAIQAAIDFTIQVYDNAGSSSTINFGLDLSATDGLDLSLGEAELPGFPPGGYAAAWLFPDFVTLSYYDYRAPGDPPAFPFTGHKSYVIKIQNDLTANPMTISWDLSSIIAATSTIGVPGNQVSFSGTGSHSWTYNPVSLQHIFVEVDYIDTTLINTFELNVSVQNGWNMVSAPGLHPTDQNVGTWWTHRTGTVWGFNGVQYVAKTVTTPGEGYWMKNTVAETYSYPAIQIVPHNPVPATLGWNMLGGYETSPTIVSLKAANPQITGTVWGFNGVQYVAATNLLPGYSYWVKTTAAGNITIPDVIAKGGEVVELFKEDWGRIILTDAAGLSYTLYSVKGEVDLEQYEMPPMPPAGSFDIRFSSGRIAEDINSSMQTIDLNGVTYPLTVRVEGMDIRLQDATGKAINANLKSGEDVVISDATIQKLMVTTELIPAQYALEQNYPNPFNPSTVIEFSLPEDVGNVKLSIYNALGEKIAELVNSSLTAGRYSYQWNAGNIASGIYIYELRTEKIVLVNKMILMK